MVRELKTGGSNPEIARGIRKNGRNVKRRKVALYIKKNGLGKKTAVKQAAPKVKDFQKGKRTIGKKIAKMYPTEKKSKPLSRRYTPGVARLRKSIQPGSVLILLTGRFRGKRVVFLKQLESGLLLVNGPFKLNGVPLRRVAQAYVQPTATVVDVSGVKVPENVNDRFFKPARLVKAADAETKFFTKKTIRAQPLSDDRKKAQASIDAALIKAVAAVPNLKAYLGSRFTLTNGQYPHELKF